MVLVLVYVVGLLVVYCGGGGDDVCGGVAGGVLCWWCRVGVVGMAVLLYCYVVSTVLAYSDRQVKW